MGIFFIQGVMLAALIDIGYDIILLLYLTHR